MPQSGPPSTAVFPRTRRSTLTRPTSRRRFPGVSTARCFVEQGPPPHACAQVPLSLFSPRGWSTQFAGASLPPHSLPSSTLAPLAPLVLCPTHLHRFVRAVPSPSFSLLSIHVPLIILAPRSTPLLLSLAQQPRPLLPGCAKARGAGAAKAARRIAAWLAHAFTTRAEILIQRKRARATVARVRPRGPPATRVVTLRWRCTSHAHSSAASAEFK